MTSQLDFHKAVYKSESYQWHLGPRLSSQDPEALPLQWLSLGEATSWAHLRLLSWSVPPLL